MRGSGDVLQVRLKLPTTDWLRDDLLARVGLLFGRFEQSSSSRLDQLLNRGLLLIHLLAKPLHDGNLLGVTRLRFGEYAVMRLMSAA